MTVSISKMLPALLACALCSCGRPSQPPQAPALPVGVIVAQPQSVPLTREFVGRLAATRSADVRARVAGVLQRRLYREGTEVKAGQPLFQIDPTPLQADLDRAQAALARAEAEATNAKIVADRARKLIAQRLISQAALDDAEAAERSAAAQMKQAQAEVQTARIRLGYASVTAPIAGRAGQQQVTEGALVGQDDATLLTMIEQIDPLYVNFNQPASVLEQLTRWQSTGSATTVAPNRAQVQIVLSDGTLYDETGTVDFSGTTVDPSTGTVAFRGVVPNPKRRLLPGMFVKIRLTLGQRNDVFLVPQTAVLRDSQGAFVWAVGANNHGEQKRVTTEAMHGKDWIVSAGIAAGDQIIVEGGGMMQPGALVKPTPAQSVAAKPAAGTAAASRSE